MSYLMMALQDQETWIILGFLLFLALAFRRAKQAIVTALDQHSATVARQIAEAAALRQESQQALAAAERDHQAVQSQVDKLIVQARDTVQRIARDGTQAIDTLLERRRALAAERIAATEAEALRAVRRAVAEVVVVATRTVLTQQAAGPLGHRLIDQIIVDLPRRLT